MSMIVRNAFRSLTAGVVLTAIGAGTASAQLGAQMGLVDPHVTHDTVIAAFPGLNATIAQKLKAARPILSLVTLDSILAANGVTKAQRTALYTSKMILHVDINRGTDAEFMLIPGMDATKLAAIKAGRPWKNFGDFHVAMMKGNSMAEASRLEQYLFIPIALNTFTKPIVMSFASIGVGTDHWAHEFDEYRPWTSKAQFDREIGKYVRNNPTEIHRLWRYVIIDPK
jgi:hypothetical protein